MMTPHPRSLWRHPQFLLFWTGESLSLFGTQVTVLALPLTAVLVLHASAFQLGAVRFLETAPYLFCALVFGAWSDRRRRKPVLLAANGARGLLISLIPVFAFCHILGLPLLAGIALGIGVFTVLFDVTWFAVVPMISPPAQRVEAIGIVTTSASLAEVAGPGLGGVLIQWWTAPVALVADAGSYVIAMLTLLMIRVHEPEPPRHPATFAHLTREIWEGVHVAFHNPYLRAITMMGGLWNFWSLIGDTIFLLYALRNRHLPPGILGLILALGAIGGVAGSAYATRLSRRRHFGPALPIAASFSCLPYLLLPALQGPSWFTIGGFTLTYLLTRIGTGLWGVLTLGLRQTLTPPQMLSRVNASMRTVSFGLGSLGALLSGILGSSFGLQGTLWIAACGFVGVWGMTIFATPLARVHALPHIDPTAEGQASEASLVPRQRQERMR